MTLWSRLDLGSRLLLATGVCLLAIGSLNQYFSIARTTEEYRLDIASEMDSTLEALEQSLAEQLVVGDYAAIQQIMSVRVRRTFMDEITWSDKRGGTLAAHHPVSPRHAPEWFRALVQLAPPLQSREISVGGTRYGTMTVRFSAANWDDRLWDGFTRRSLVQLFELAALFLVFFLVSRGSLRQVKNVATLTQRFIAGDHSVRATVPPGTPPDIRALLATLNHAADALEAMLMSLSEQRGATDNAAIVSETDLAFKIAYVNDKFCEVSGYSRAELLGQDHRILNCDCHPLSFFQEIDKTLAEAEVWHGEIGNRRKDGSLFWTDTTITPILDETGKPIKYVDIRFDITELKQAEEKIKHDYHVQKAVGAILQASLQPLSLEDELEQALDAIFSVPWVGKDTGGAIFLLDENAPDMLILTSQRGLPPSVRTGCTRLALGECVCGQAAATRESILSRYSEQRHTPPIAGMAAHDVLCVPIHSGDTPYGVITLYLEHGRPRSMDEFDFLRAIADTLAGVIARKRAEHLTQRLGRIVDGSLNEIYVFDAETLHFIQANRGACRNLGYTQDELKTLMPTDLNPHLEQELFEALLRPVRSGELEQLVFETVHRRKNGSTYPVEVRLQFSDIAATPVFLAFVQDITERKRVELEITQSREQLRELSAYLQTAREEEKVHIAREIHDELGGTLTALKMDAFWLAKKMPAELAPLHEKVTAMSQLVDSAVQATRRIVTELRPTLLDDLGLVAAIEWQAAEFQKRSGLACRLALPPADVGVDHKYSIALFRILQESLTNIARHAHASSVDVTLEMADNDLVMTIHDDGCGISRERVLNPTSHGLRGIFERARQLGGAAEIAGGAASGTTVTITLPMAEYASAHD
jgi:PAS domain S-box-containing protein